MKKNLENWSSKCIIALYTVAHDVISVYISFFYFSSISVDISLVWNKICLAFSLYIYICTHVHTELSK